MRYKQSAGFISLAMLAIVFVVTSVVGIGAGRQVKKTQVSQSQATCDNPAGCGGSCNPTVNQGCYAGGCRAWEWCNPTNKMCEWEQSKIGVNQKCEQKLAEGRILAPNQSAQPQPTQQQAQPAASNTQNTMPAGSCDPKWYCLGECADSTVRNAFGNNDAQWRREKANNEKKSGACDNPATTQGQTSQQQAQPSSSGGNRTGATCQASGLTFQAGECQSAGTRKVVCDPSNLLNAVNITYEGKPYTGWVASDSCYQPAVSSIK